jgi:hypothetical protein
MRRDRSPWVTGHFKKLATAIFRATPLTAEETEEVAQVVEMGAMKAWVECERAKGRADLRSHGSNCVRELALRLPQISYSKRYTSDPPHWRRGPRSDFLTPGN